MKIGFIVDGQGEPQALGMLFAQIQCGHVLLQRVLYADMQPRATPPQIARSAQAAVKRMVARAVDRIVVLVDGEGDVCPGALAQSIASAFAQMYRGVRFDVVIKNRKFENWLVADPDALVAMPARFAINPAFVQWLRTERDEVVDAEQLLTSVVKGTEYHKRSDPPKIAAKQCPIRISRNSRSFRRLLRILDAPHYLAQSKNPVRRQFSPLAGQHVEGNTYGRNSEQRARAAMGLDSECATPDVWLAAPERFAVEPIRAHANDEYERFAGGFA